MSLTGGLQDVKALLEQLRVSKSWQDTAAQQQPPSSPAQNQGQNLPPAYPSESQESSPADTSSRVAQLLAQLKSGPSSTTPSPVQSEHPPPVPPSSYRSRDEPALSVPPRAVPDLRNCSFSTALSLISALGDDPSFLASIKELQKEQDALERQLWTDRESIQKKYEDKVKVAQTRATMTGGSISQHEATMLQDSFQRELRKHDEERSQLAWEGLVTRQQARLEQLGVPSMFVTGDLSHRARQAKIIQVLVGLAEAST